MKKENAEINIIAAVAKNNAIGLNNQLIWHLPNDLKYFKMLTINEAIIMGKNTFFSIGKPLPNRLNIVISSNENLQIEGATVCKTFANAIETAKQSGRKIFVAGGANVYSQAIAIADSLYITEVDISPEADTFFPKINMEIWEVKEVTLGIIDEKNIIPHRFIVYKRK